MNCHVARQQRQTGHNYKKSSVADETGGSFNSNGFREQLDELRLVLARKESDVVASPLTVAS